MLESCDAPSAAADTLPESERGWRELLPASPLQPHARHRFTELRHDAPATHVRLNIYPDGGIARLRLFGRLESAGAGE
jgi:allantoicase